MVSKPYSRTIDPIKLIKRQNLQIELLRKKVFLIQELMIRNSQEKSCALDNPLSRIFPVEKFYSTHSSDTVISFGGMISKLGMAPKEFMKSFIDKNINILFLKDFQQCWYQKGLLGISKNVVETVEFIRGELPINQQHVCTVGTSAGGYAAILFGVLLGADKVIAFGPQTIINKNIFKRFKSVDSREQELGTDTRFLDLIQVLESTEYNGEIHVHFAENHPVDRQAAERLSSFPTVRLHSYPGDDHNIAGWLKRNGKLNEILAGAVT